ncbi:MAG: trigger factor [Candidatus Cloacimonetes bacterium]|nr:trigger factor [Candidatus Cloacimonadota bacterium]
MKTEIKVMESGWRELTVTVPAEETTKDYRKVVNQYRNKVNIPGFRKGKAPLKMVEQLYADHFKEEFILKQPEVYYKQALDELDLHPIIEAEILDVKWEEGTDFVAIYKFQVMPEIEVVKYEGLEVIYRDIEYTDDMLDKALENMRSKFATQEEAEEVANGSFVKIALLDSSEGTDEPISLERDIVVGDNLYCEEMNNKLIGLKAGDIIQSKIFKDKENQAEEENDEYQKFRDKEFSIKVLSIKQDVLPELNDEFAIDAGFENLEELKSNIIEDYQIKIAEQNSRNKIKSVEIALVEANQIEIPEVMVHNYAEQLAEDAAKQYGIEKEKLVEGFLPIAEMNMKVYYLKNKVTEILDIQITDEDKEETIKKAAGNLKIDIEKYKELYAKELASEDFEFSIREQKTLDYLIEKAVFVEPAAEVE